MKNISEAMKEFKTNESSEDHIKKGYRTITGKVLSDEEVKAYNVLTDKINAYTKKGRKAPEELLNGRHNLFYQSGIKENYGDIVDGWSKELSEEVSKLLNNMKKKLEGEKANLDRFETNPKEVYLAVLDKFEKNIVKNFKVYRKL